MKNDIFKIAATESMYLEGALISADFLKPQKGSKKRVNYWQTQLAFTSVAELSNSTEKISNHKYLKI